MGFSVGIDDQSSRIIELVTVDPSQVLGQLYPAFLLFLIGEPDADELQWLLDNAKALDSVTGTDVAFAVFAREFTVKLWTSEPSSRSKPARVGKITVDAELKKTKVVPLIKHGRFGRVMDGDELTAITYGTDIVARELGLLDKLPCMVIIDAVPKETLCVICLDKELTGSLIHLMRKSIAIFTSDGSAQKVRGFAERIIYLQRSIADSGRTSYRGKKRVERLTIQIEKLRAGIARGRPKDSPELQAILLERETERQSEMDRLERQSAERDQEIERITAELDKLLKEYWTHEDLLFSEIFKEQVKSFGLHTKVASGKATALSFLGSVFKPESLIKIWEAVHHH